VDDVISGTVVSGGTAECCRTPCQAAVKFKILLLLLVFDVVKHNNETAG